MFNRILIKKLDICCLFYDYIYQYLIIIWLSLDLKEWTKKCVCVVFIILSWVIGLIFVILYYVQANLVEGP